MIRATGPKRTGTGSGGTSTDSVVEPSDGCILECLYFLYVSFIQFWFSLVRCFVFFPRFSAVSFCGVDLSVTRMDWD